MATRKLDREKIRLPEKPASHRVLLELQPNKKEVYAAKQLPTHCVLEGGATLPHTNAVRDGNKDTALHVAGAFLRRIREHEIPDERLGGALAWSRRPKVLSGGAAARGRSAFLRPRGRRQAVHPWQVPTSRTHGHHGVWERDHSRHPPHHARSRGGKANHRVGKRIRRVHQAGTCRGGRRSGRLRRRRVGRRILRPLFSVRHLIPRMHTDGKAGVAKAAAATPTRNTVLQGTEEVNCCVSNAHYWIGS